MLPGSNREVANEDVSSRAVCHDEGDVAREACVAVDPVPVTPTQILFLSFQLKTGLCEALLPILGARC